MNGSQPLPDDEASSVLQYLVHLLPVDEAAVSALGHHVPLGTIAATSTRALMLDLTQITLGEGPAWDAFDLQHVYHLDTGDTDHRERWPHFSSAVADFFTQTATAVPVAIGSHRVGAVTLYSSAPAALEGPQLSLAANLGTLLARAILDGAHGNADVEGRSLPGTDVATTAHVLAERAGTTPAEALLALRHYAFRSGIALREVPPDLGIGDLGLPFDG